MLSFSNLQYKVNSEDNIHHYSGYFKNGINHLESEDPTLDVLNLTSINIFKGKIITDDLTLDFSSLDKVSTYIVKIEGEKLGSFTAFFLHPLDKETLESFTSNLKKLKEVTINDEKEKEDKLILLKEELLKVKPSYLFIDLNDKENKGNEFLFFKYFQDFICPVFLKEVKVARKVKKTKVIIKEHQVLKTVFKDNSFNLSFLGFFCLLLSFLLPLSFYFFLTNQVLAGVIAILTPVLAVFMIIYVNSTLYKEMVTKFKSKTDRLSAISLISLFTMIIEAVGFLVFILLGKFNILISGQDVSYISYLAGLIGILLSGLVPFFTYLWEKIDA